MPPDLPTLVEREARRRWLEYACWWGWGTCEECGYDAIVAQQDSTRKQLCFGCWEQGFR